MDERMWKAMQAAAQYVANDPHLAELRKKAEAMEAAGLSTDGPTPPPCDPKIFTEGVQVFVTDTIPSNAMEGWVRQVAEKSEQPVDWHFAYGRAEVLALGDVDRVRIAVQELMPEHDRLRDSAIAKILRG